VRLFVAIPVPQAVRDEAARVASLLAPVIPRARWVPPQNVHLTLAFLGEVSEPAPVFEAIESVARATGRCSIFLDGAGCFPSERRARVVWLGLGGETDALANAASEVRGALVPLGIAIEDRPFAAHLTIGRLREPARLLTPLPVDVDPVGFEVAEITVYRSRLQRPAPVYEPLQVCRLAGPSP